MLPIDIIVNEFLNEFFCNLFLKNIKNFSNASHFFG
jgi:hypothetical protein